MIWLPQTVTLSSTYTVYNFVRCRCSYSTTRANRSTSKRENITNRWETVAITSICFPYSGSIPVHITIFRFPIKQSYINIEAPAGMISIADLWKVKLIAIVPQLSFIIMTLISKRYQNRRQLLQSYWQLFTSGNEQKLH